MKSLKQFNQAGNTTLLALLALGLIVISALVGYRVIQSSNSQTDSSTNQSQSEDQQASSQTDIKTQQDVTNAANELDSTDIDAQVNTDQLDSDLNSIL